MRVDDLLQPPLTTDEDRRRAYRDDVYFRESALRLGALEAAERDRLLMRSTFLVFKPEAVAGRRMGPALRYLSDRGFQVLGACRVAFDARTVRELWRYQLNAAPLPVVRAVDLIVAAGDCVFTALRDTRGPVPGGPPAAVRLSDLKGSSGDLEADRGRGLLREALGCVTQCLNFVHAPDEPADLIRELGVLFAWPDLVRVLRLLAGPLREGAAAEVDALIRELYDGHAAHHLDPAASRRALRDAAAAHPQDAEMIADVLRALDRDAPEEELLRLIDWLERGTAAAQPWDRVTLASYLVANQESDRMPLIGPPPGERASARSARVAAVAAERLTSAERSGR